MRTFNYFNREKTVPSPVGSATKDEFTLVQDGNNLSLKKIGTINTHEMIQSHRDSVDLHKLIERFKRGDVSALDRRRGMFMDATDAPTDMREYLHQVRAAVTELNEQRSTQEPTKESTQEPTKESTQEPTKEPTKEPTQEVE